MAEQVDGGGGAQGRERDARALLSAIVAPGDPQVGRLLRVYGARRLLDAVRAEAVGAASAGDDPARAAVRTALARYLPRARELDVGQVLDAAEAAGARFVCPGELEWPSQLGDLGDTCPLGLWLRGDRHLRTCALRSVAVVGARACTPYGAYMAGELAAMLAERDWTVASGAAFGVDAAAHRGALAVRGLTIGVLACGVDVAYPRAHHELLATIAAHGVLVSEHPPGATPRRHAFIRRNRVLAALTRGCVVVEAAVRSGSLSTARSAADLGRQVMGVPGPVTSTASTGVHGLIRDGCAALVETAADVVELVGRIGADLAPVRRGQERPLDTLDSELALVLDAVPIRSPAPLSTIVQAAAVATSTARRALDELGAQGWVIRVGDGWQVNPDAPGRMLDRSAPGDHVG